MRGRHGSGNYGHAGKTFLTKRVWTRWLSPIEEWVIELEDVRGKENEARKVAMYLVRRCWDQTLQETARIFGLGSYGAVGWCCQEDMEFGVELFDHALADEILRFKFAAPCNDESG